MIPIKFNVQKDNREITVNCFYYGDLAGQLYMTIEPFNEFINSGEFDDEDAEMIKAYFNSIKYIITIDWIEVFPEYQSMGIGGKLLDYGLRIYRKNNFSDFLLNACAGENGLTQKDLIKFYKSRGFNIIIEHDDTCLMGLNGRLFEAISRIISKIF